MTVTVTFPNAVLREVRGAVCSRALDTGLDDIEYERLQEALERIDAALWEESEEDDDDSA